MRNFALVSAVVSGTAYHRDIIAITWPRMQAYCDKWEIDFYPLVAAADEVSWTLGSPAPAGTGVDYWSIPKRRELLDHYNGVVFLDADVLILSDEFDICREVNDNVQIAAVGAINGGVMVMRSGPHSKRMLDLVWDQREHYRHFQWLEQAAFMELVGYEIDMREGVFGHRPTEWSDKWTAMSPRWNWGPRSPALEVTSDPRYNTPLFYHPMGVQPYSLRLQTLKDRAAEWPDPSDHYGVHATQDFITEETQRGENG